MADSRVDLKVLKAECSVDKMVAYSAVWKGTSTADLMVAWSVVVTVDLKDT